MKLARSDVYDIIDGERRYQDATCGRTGSSGKPGSGERSIDEFICYISGYANQAVALASTFGGEQAKLETIRKLAALAVHCMEQHGAPPRIVEETQWPKPGNQFPR